MKKVVSILLAFVMLVGMLPGAALTVSAAGINGELHAYYTNTDITVDGKLDESGWLLDQMMGSTPIAMQCSFDTLYVGLKTGADKVIMTVNGVSVVANFGTNTVTVGGESAGSLARSSTNGTIELSIPLASLGLTYDVAQEVSFALEVGVDRFSGTVILAPHSLAIFEDCLNADSNPEISRFLSSSAAEQWAEASETGIHYQTGTMTKDGVSISVPAWTLSRVAPSVDLAKGYDLNFNVDFNDLVIPAEVGPLDRFALTGFFVDARFNGRNHIGFHADAEGNIYVTQYENVANAIQPIDIGLDLPVKDVDVRILVNDYFEAQVFVNGNQVAKFGTSVRTGTPGTLYFHTSTRYRENDLRKNDVVLRDIKLTQAAPNMSFDAARLPREGVITQDGSLSETCWALTEAVSGVKLGALVDTENLYLALNTQASSVTFNLGEYTINTTLGKSPKVTVGYTMGSTIKGDGKGGYEITVPLSLLKLDKSLGETMPFTVSSGNNSKTFALGLGTSTLSLAEYQPVNDDGLRNATAYLNTDTLTLDGALKENQWHIAHEAAGPATAPAADFGFLWDGKYLYIGSQVFSASQADKLELTMGGKTFTADLTAATATLGDIAVQGQYFEWRVPLADLGVEQGINVEKEYKLSITAAGGTSFIQGKLLFAAKSMVFGDACRDFNSREYTVITASSVKYTKWEQGDGYYNVWSDTEALGSGNEAHQHFTSLLNYDGGGDYEFEVDVTAIDLPNVETTIGWRGLCWELREPEFQTRFCLRSDGKGQVIMDYLGNRGPASIPTGVKLGERAVYTVKVSDKLIADVYVNGEYVGTFPALDRTNFTIVDNYHMPRMIMQNVNHTRALNADGTLGAVNAYVHDIKMVENIYDDVPGMLENTMLALTEDSVLTGNDPDPENVTALKLPTELTGLGLPCQVKWTAVDRATGEIADYVNVDTGIVTPGDKPVSFTLTADVSYEGISASKSFVFSTQGKKSTGNVSMILNDVDPRVGQATDWIRNEFAFFDTTRNSLVYDQGSSKQFNTITLRDLDEVSRVSQQHLGVFISEDGKTYTKVNGWLMHQNGSEYTIYNLNAKARYVKVHTYHDDLEREGEQPSFYNSIRDMISVSNNPYLPGAGGTFAHKAEYAVKTSGKDLPVFISLADLGAKAGQYKNGCADFRFTIGGTTLAYWYNGSDGFYVRVPSAPATVTAHWGCGSAADFSNAENVFEVSYGNVALMDLTAGTDFSSHGRPWTMSNGDIIVVGRRYVSGKEDGSLALVRSTDGGRTFDNTASLVAPNLSGWALGFGGYLYDDQLDRLYVIGYIGSTKDSNDYRLFLTYTDDCGYTWSDWFCLSNPVKEPVKDNDVFVSNMPEDTHRAILYSEGLALKDRDGDGPNVDYVIVYNDTHQTTKVNAMVSVYSKDGGKTWLAGEGEISMPQVDASKEYEDGISEHSFTQLDDGSLHVYCRAQHLGNYYFYEGISYDYGNTWVSDFSKVVASNTSPVTMKYNNDRILLWSSYNSEGQKSYLRAPMHVGYTTDEYKSFEKVIDLTFGTSYDGLYEQYYHFTQPGIAFTKDSKDAVVTFWDASTYRRHNLGVRATIGFLVEEFDQMLYGNKGGYEDFETASLKYEGWLKHPGDNFDLSREQSASGLWSMKLDGAQPLYATRQIPSMKSGTVGAKVLAPAGNAADFYMTLKAGYNFNHLQNSVAAVAIGGDGTISVANADGSKNAVAKVQPGSWVDLAISFDIASKTGKLSVNGEAVGDIELNLDGPLYDGVNEDALREVTCVQFVQPVTTGNKTSTLYVDDFYCTELTSAIKRAAGTGFADVKEGDWFYNAVNFAVANGIMSGYNATTFGPNDTLNRAMVVQVLYNKEGQPALNGLKHSFSDVPAGQWFNNAVTWGSNRGVVSGFGGGVFKPEDAVTIEQVAVILWNYSHNPGAAGDLSDVGAHSDWAANALRWAAGEGILAGVPFTNATEKATRAQTAQILTNYLRAI